MGPENVAATLPAECLLAVTGIFPGRAPSDTQRQLADPEKFVARLGRRVRAYLESDEPGKYKPPTIPKDQEAYHKKILEPVDLAEVAEWFPREEDAELATHYGLLLQAARTKLTNAWPVFPDPSFGVHNFDLATDELLDVVAVFRTLDGVESLFDDMDANVLLPSQVTDLAEAFPALCAAIKEETIKELAPHLEIQGHIEATKPITPIKEEQIRILLQLPMDAPMQVQPEQPGTPGNPSRPVRRPPDEGQPMATPSESTIAKRAAK